ncbi:DUF1648 domain-containing protein [Paenibacillus sp. FSL K6-3182]|uniref:DUF1648 domain-containing protein n=1 Tax=Paenibacillus sp. FSL K6-3182 TaxID=2921495 RepID=UPI0030CFE83F
MANLPKLTIAKSNLERWHDGISVLLLLSSVIYLIVKWPDLPQTIAIHFNGRGEADGWGSKAALVILPIISFLLFAGLALLRKIPHEFNYMTTITEQNAPYQYKTSILLLSWIKLEIVALFAYVQWAAIQVASGGASKLGIWLLPVILVILIGTIVFYVMKSKK